MKTKRKTDLETRADYVISEKKCAKCGKTFIAQYGHIFKEHGKWYCTWTCYNHRKDKKGTKGEKA